MSESQKIDNALLFLFRHIKRAILYTLRVFNIREGTDVEGTITNIRNNIRVKGYNLWLLIASAMIASVGLDLNSPAVIIGAMLISPLMSPILGIGLAIGTTDREMLYDANRNFLIAVFISFATSTFYFLITPLGQPQPEMLARIEPTLLDVGVAFFGGVAGIVAGSRSEKTNALPGVAIATALMPPLCVSGFGFATGRFDFFFGAFYLFFLNAVFISLSTFFVVRLLKFPRVSYLDPMRERKIARWMAVIVFIIVIPSMYLLYAVISDLRMKNNIEHFLDQSIESHTNEVIRFESVDEDTTRVLRVFIVGDYISPVMRDSLSHKLEQYHLEDHRLELIQINLPKEERDLMASEISGNLIRLVEGNARVSDSLSRRVTRLERKLTGYRNDSLLFRDLKESLPGHFPELTYFGIAEAVATDFSKKDIAVTSSGDTVEAGYSVRTQPVILLDWKRSRSTRDYEKRLTEAIRIKFADDSLRIISLPGK